MGIAVWLGGLGGGVKLSVKDGGGLGAGARGCEAVDSVRSKGQADRHCPWAV